MNCPKLHGWRFVALLVWGCASQLCFPDGVLEENRSYITNELGEFVSLTLLQRGDEPSQLAAAAAKVVLEEIMGYKVVISDTSATGVTNAAMRVAGCADFIYNYTYVSNVHAALKSWVWWDSTDRFYYDYFRILTPSRAPEQLGSVGIIEGQGLCVSGHLVRDVSRRTSTGLDYFRSYNASINRARIHFDDKENIARLEDYRLCNESGTVWTHTDSMNQYVSMTGHGLSHSWWTVCSR